jgi:hypothetical protein
MLYCFRSSQQGNAEWTVGAVKIAVDDESHIVKASYEGVLDKESVANIASQARVKAYELGYNLLYDMRNATVGASIADIYSIPRQLASIDADKAAGVRTAYLISPEADMESWHFYENTARNAGLNCKTFESEADALSWLMAAESRE